jgi:hypothetical protein
VVFLFYSVSSLVDLIIASTANKICSCFSWFLFKKKSKTSFILSGIAFILMLSFLFVDEIIVNDGSTTSIVNFYGLGYWFWVFSSFIMLVGNSIHWKKNKYKPQHII